MQKRCAGQQAAQRAGQESADHVQGAMGEVDDPQNAEHQGQAGFGKPAVQDGMGSEIDRSARPVRLARGGAKKRPFFNIVVADSRTRRDGRFIERVGFYNPVAGEGARGRLVTTAGGGEMRFDHSPFMRFLGLLDVHDREDVGREPQLRGEPLSAVDDDEDDVLVRGQTYQDGSDR